MLGMCAGSDRGLGDYSFSGLSSKGDGDLADRVAQSAAASTFEVCSLTDSMCTCK